MEDFESKKPKLAKQIIAGTSTGQGEGQGYEWW